MKKEGKLIARASKDIALAARHKKGKDYVTATLLYNKAVEEILGALFIRKTKKAPPLNASAEYLARQTGVPEEISIYIKSMNESQEMQPVNELIDLESYKESSSEMAEEREAFYMGGLAKRLLDYVVAYA